MEKKSQAPFNKYKQDFNKENYERLSVYVTPGSRDKIRAHAETRGESLNAFINRAIREQIRRDRAESVQPSENVPPDVQTDDDEPPADKTRA